MPHGGQVLTTLESIGVHVIREGIHAPLKPKTGSPVSLTSAGGESVSPLLVFETSFYLILICPSFRTQMRVKICIFTAKLSLLMGGRRHRELEKSFRAGDLEYDLLLHMDMRHYLKIMIK